MLACSDIIAAQAEVPDRNQICPDRSRRKVPMSRPSQTQSAYVQTIVRSCPDHRAFIRVSRPCNFERTTPPSCVHFGLDISGFGLGPQPGWFPKIGHLEERHLQTRLYGQVQLYHNIRSLKTLAKEYLYRRTLKRS